MDSYKIAHIIQDKFSWLWDFIEWGNSILFSLRYGRKVKSFCFTTIPDGYELVPMKEISALKMVEFFNHQPEDAYTFFKPHGFDEKSVIRLQKNRSFLAYVLKEKESGKIAGYCFNRCFFHGKGFRGRMVDIDSRGRGLATAMNRILNEVGFGIGLRLFETVSRDNVASFRSAQKASSFKVVKELPHNELFLEIIKD